MSSLSFVDTMLKRLCLGDVRTLCNTHTASGDEPRDRYIHTHTHTHKHVQHVWLGAHAPAAPTRHRQDGLQPRQAHGDGCRPTTAGLQQSWLSWR